MKVKKLFIWFLALFSIFCFSEPTPAAKKSSTVKIGVFLPMTGSAEIYGQTEWAGIKIANQIKPFVLGRKVKLILVDTKSEKTGASNAVSRLIKKNGVCAIIGDAINENTTAAGQIAEKARIPIISPSATNPMVTRNRNYVFRACFSAPFQGEIAAKYAYNIMGARKAAIMIDIAQDYCISLSNSFVKSFINMGGKIAVTTYCQTGDRDFTVHLSAIMAAKPDVLYMPNYYTEDALTCKQATELGMKIPILSADGAKAEELIKIGKKDVEGLAFTWHFTREGAETDLAKKYIKTYETKNGKEASAFDALGADAYFVLLDAIERAKSTRGSRIRAALADTKDFKGVSGTINIDNDGNTIKSAVMLHVKEGEFRYLATVNP
jgi:branched-chain amino acid transport system substrate-binding protein